MHARFRGPKSLLTFYQIINLISLEIAEPRPDMSFKVAALTVSKKSIYSSSYCCIATAVILAVGTPKDF